MRYPGDIVQLQYYSPTNNCYENVIGIVLSVFTSTFTSLRFVDVLSSKGIISRSLEDQTRIIIQWNSKKRFLPK